MSKIINPIEPRNDRGGGNMPFVPKRAASWWSRLEDLQWPEKRARDMILRRADAFAAADVDTVIQFGFHFRFDWAPYFSAVHRLFAAIAEALHERDIKFLDHYSCNLQARPSSEEQRMLYHTHQRHHVDLYPDGPEAETAGYAGYRFRDLCEVDLVTGKPAYTPIYQAEMLCHNNPNFLAMHSAYLKRLFSDVPLDGIQADDMCIYNFFRSCGCEFCRERFRREYGHELPPLSDVGFWGETSGELDFERGTSGDSRFWGNYDNPAFRDWVLMRYATPADHLKVVRDAIGPDKVLMTCCSTSAPQVLNAMGMSYEGAIDTCDWVMLENCGLGARTVKWTTIEPEGNLQKSIAVSKSDGTAATVALSYTIFDDGAYLGWALAQFWGVTNWISTLTTGLLEQPDHVKEEPELIAPYNNWECRNETSEGGEDVIDARVAFLRANRDCAWKDAEGVEYWQHSRRWAQALVDRNVGYRFLISRELSSPDFAARDKSPLILDGCACVSDVEYSNVQRFLESGGAVWIVPPFGTHNERGFKRERVLLDRLKASCSGESLRILDGQWSPEIVDELVSDGRLSPSATVVGENLSWAVRLRKTDRGFAVHLLNKDLEGIEHPTITDRWGETKVLDRIVSHASDKPLDIKLSLPGVEAGQKLDIKMLSPELDKARVLSSDRECGGDISLKIDMSGLRIYGVVEVTVS